MKEGVDKINKFGMDCYAEDVMGKGITSDASKKQFQRDRNATFMKSIEEQLMPNLSKDYSLKFRK
jgi:hypothetical protein